MLRIAHARASRPLSLQGRGHGRPASPRRPGRATSRRGAAPVETARTGGGQHERQAGSACCSAQKMWVRLGGQKAHAHAKYKTKTVENRKVGSHLSRHIQIRTGRDDLRPPLCAEREKGRNTLDRRNRTLAFSRRSLDSSSGSFQPPLRLSIVSSLCSSCRSATHGILNPGSP